MQLRTIILGIFLYYGGYAVSAASTANVQVAEEVKRIVYNNSSEDLFFQWYNITNAKSGAGDKIASKPLTKVIARKWGVIPDPSLNQYTSTNLRLVCSYKEDAYEPTLTFKVSKASTPSRLDFTALTLADLGNIEKINVFVEPSLAQNVSRVNAVFAPMYCKEHTVISVVNTTNQQLHCAPYEIQKKGRHTRLSGAAPVNPQHTLLFTFEPGKKTYRLAFCLKNERSPEANLPDEITNEKLKELVAVEIQNPKPGVEQEYVVLPSINADTDDAAVSKNEEFAVVPPQALKKPLFFLDQVISRFHKLPELNVTERAEFESSSIEKRIAQFDKNMEATEYGVREDFDLPAEREFVQRRKTTVSKGLKKLFEQDLVNGKIRDTDITIADLEDPELLPTIALVSTGGGYRAMIETIGFLEGAEEVGVFDCLTYMCGLSGSTWAVNSLVASNKSVREFADELKRNVSKSESISLPESKLSGFRDALTNTRGLEKDGPIDDFVNLLFALSKSHDYKLRKFIQSKFAQTQGFVGLYGHALVERLLRSHLVTEKDGQPIYSPVNYSINGKTDQHSIMLSDLRESLKGASPRYPLPFSVCLQSPSNAQTDETFWFEFSPYYTGTYDKKHAWHIQTHRFGSFYVGKSLQYRCPEYPLGQLFGTFGSAMALSEETLETHEKTRAKTVLALLTSLKADGIGMHFDEARLTAGVAPNFLYHEKTKYTTNLPKMAREKFLRLVDGGMLSVDVDGVKCCHNFASLPALQRHCDVLILTDCSGKPSAEDNALHLKATYYEANKFGFDLPELTEEQMSDPSRDYSGLFMSNEPTVPSLVYVLCKKNEQIVKGFNPDASKNRYTQTHYFFYEEGTYDNLRTLAKGLFKMEINVSNIKKAIVEAIKRKKQNRRNPGTAPTVAPAAPAPMPQTHNKKDDKSYSHKKKSSKSRSVKKSRSREYSPEPRILKTTEMQQIDYDDDIDDKIVEKKASNRAKIRRNRHTDDKNDISDSEGSEEDSNDKIVVNRPSKSRIEERRSIESPSNKDVPVTVQSTAATTSPAVPKDNPAFQTFKGSFPVYAVANTEAMKKAIEKTLPKDSPYESFAEFMAYAAENNNVELVKFLIEQTEKADSRPGVNNNNKPLSQIFATVKQEILTVGWKEDPVYCRPNEMTPLHWAARHGNKDMFTLLLNKNIFALGCKNNDKKQTPVHIAAEAVANDSALKINQKICIDTALNFFEDIDSITIDHPRHTEMLKKLVEAMFKPKDSVDSAEKTVADYLAQDAELKKRIRRILIKYYVSSGL